MYYTRELSVIEQNTLILALAVNAAETTAWNYGAKRERKNFAVAPGGQ